MKRRAIAAVVFVLALLPITGVGVVRWGEPYLRARLARMLIADCATCALDIRSLHLRGRTVVARGLTFTSGDEGDHQRWRLLADAIEIRPEWTTLIASEVRLASILIRAPQVSLIDTAGGRPRPESTPDDEGAGVRRGFAIGATNFTDGTFTYVRNHGPSHAVIVLRRVRGEVGPLGNAPARRDDDVTASATLQMGFSGETRLIVKAKPFAPRHHADVELFINDQNLTDLSAFFAPNAGVKISGALSFAHARTKLRDRHTSTEVRAVFDDFDIEVEPTPDRGAWTAAFTNLGLSIGVKQSNVALSEREQTRRVAGVRRPHETLVGFVLRGIKDAAISVAKKPTARALTE